MTAAGQLHLAIQLPVSRPLIPLRAAMVLLDRGEDEVLALIDTGELSWAWDISSQDAERREVRIWRDSVLQFLSRSEEGNQRWTRMDLPAPPPSRQAGTDEEERVLLAILPHSAEVRSTTLQRLFTASQGHIQNLINAGLLTGLNDPRTGPHRTRTDRNRRR
jgi:hypothetical protein